MPARMSISAPTRPAMSTCPAVWYITRAISFSNVDLPAPLAPTRAHDSPGSARNATSRRTQRHVEVSFRRT